MKVATDKAIIFLVEGDTDELSLGGIMQKYLKPRREYFQVIGTDITSDYDTNPSNILTKINREIHCKLDEIKLFESDLVSVVHLVDMDGAYVSDDCIREMNPIDHWIYNQDVIFVSSKEEAVKRNKRKRENLEALQSLNCVGMGEEIPYRVFYFSCNLEHVLHNNAYVPSKIKRSMADEFADRYYCDVKGFVDFISNSDFSVDGSWRGSWDFIKSGEKSLHRYTNFGLFFTEAII